MAKNIFETMNEAGQASYEAAKEAFAINTAAVENLVQKQLKVAEQAVELGTKQVKLVSEAKDVRAAVAAQAELVEDAAEQALDNARDLVDIVNKTRDAYGKLIEKGVKELQAKAAKKAA